MKGLRRVQTGGSLVGESTLKCTVSLEYLEPRLLFTSSCIIIPTQHLSPATYNVALNPRLLEMHGHVTCMTPRLQPQNQPLGNMTTTCIATNQTRLVGDDRIEKTVCPAFQMHCERFYLHAKQLKGTWLLGTFASS